MSFNNENKTQSSIIEYQIFRIFDTILAFITLTFFICFLGYKPILSLIAGNFNNVITTESVIALVFLIFLALLLKAVISGPRSLSINSNTLEIIYPQETTQIKSTELIDLKIKKYSKKGRSMANIRFKDHDEKRHSFVLPLRHANAMKVLTWFQSINNTTK